MDKKTSLSVISPAFAAFAYLCAALIADNRNVRRVFSVMCGLMSGVCISELFLYLNKNEAEEQ